MKMNLLAKSVLVTFLLFLPCLSGMIASDAEKNEYEAVSEGGSLFMIIGTYTSGKSNGIYVYRFDEETGTSAYVSEIEAANPTFLAISSDERYVYSVGENNGEAAVAYAFSFDKANGKLNLLNSQQTNSPGPCYINTDHTGRFVVTANYGGGTVSVFPLATDGSLRPVEKVFDFEGTATGRSPQDKPHLHCAVFSPDRSYLFAANLGSDLLHKYTISTTTPFLTAGNPDSYKLEPGSGPRHLTFHPNSKYAYLINELSGKVTVFNYAAGNLEPVQYIAADNSEGEGRKGSADIHVTPDGKFLYASNRARTNNIAIFRINETDGKLTLVGHQATGQHPRNFVITPNGKYLLAANMNSSTIQVFEINRETGLLNEDISKQITEVDRPVCLKFVTN